MGNIDNGNAFGYLASKLVMRVLAFSVSQWAVLESKSFNPNFCTERINPSLRCLALSALGFPSMMMTFGTIYALSAGVTHSAQYALAAMLKAANDGEFNFVEVVKEYGAKAKIMKKLFTNYGFKIVYDMDEDEPIADGFYFTFSYPGFTGEELLSELIYYGISAISLAITGSERLEGVRACVSLVQRDQFDDQSRGNNACTASGCMAGRRKTGSAARNKSLSAGKWE